MPARKTKSKTRPSVDQETMVRLMASLLMHSMNVGLDLVCPGCSAAFFGSSGRPVHAPECASIKGIKSFIARGRKLAKSPGRRLSAEAISHCAEEWTIGQLGNRGLLVVTGVLAEDEALSVGVRTPSFLNKGNFNQLLVNRITDAIKQWLDDHPDLMRLHFDPRTAS